MNPNIDFSELPLRDIHLPDPVSWWPPAPGWWILAALVLAGIAVLALRYYRERRRRAALKSLRGVLTALEAGAEPVHCLQQVSMLLRRFAITTAAPDGDPTDVAGLIGERWLAHLDSTWDRDSFRNGPGRVLLAGPYGRPDTVTRTAVAAVADLAAAWIKRQPTAPLTTKRSRRLREGVRGRSRASERRDARVRATQDAVAGTRASEPTGPYSRRPSNTPSQAARTNTTMRDGAAVRIAAQRQPARRPDGITARRVTAEAARRAAADGLARLR